MAEHPITPPPELVQQWLREAAEQTDTSTYDHLAICAAQWGADTELEACCELITKNEWFADPSYRLSQLLEGRRPKPPSLKQQVLATLQYPKDLWSEDEMDAIRRLLEQLDD